MLKKITYTMLLTFPIFINNINAQESPIFPKGTIGANKDNYTGTIWLSELNHPDSIFNFGIAQAVYAESSKLNWHLHPAGQYLLITEGTGYYQERGKPVQVVHKGDIIKCMPGVEHWHGSTPNTTFTYIGITPTQKGKTNWLDKVTDEEYNSIPAPAPDTTAKQQIIELSKKKWQWMSDKNTDSLNTLFDDKSMFVHMGGSWGKEQELNVIKSGNIWYKKAEVYSVTVNIIGNTAILLNDIDLEAVVGGNTVVNPFMVTEVYVKENGKWQMGSLTFSRLLRPVKMNTTNQQH